VPDHWPLVAQVIDGSVALPLNRGLCGDRGIYITQTVDSNQGMALNSRTKLSDAGRETAQPLPQDVGDSGGGAVVP
jgi:hypothetical protein